MANDSMKMRLVGDDEFDEESLSGEDAIQEGGIHELRITRKGFSSMSGCTQVVVFLMFWCITLGTSMLVFHIVARDDANRQTVILVGLAASWIGLINIFAFAAFIIDKYRSFNDQPRMSEALALTQFLLGGIVGGWLALCVTCYRPPGVKGDKTAGFICRGMLCSCVGIAIIIFLLLRALIPNIELLNNFTSSP